MLISFVRDKFRYIIILVCPILIMVFFFIGIEFWIKIFSYIFLNFLTFIFILVDRFDTIVLLSAFFKIIINSLTYFGFKKTLNLIALFNFKFLFILGFIRAFFSCFDFYPSKFYNYPFGTSVIIYCFLVASLTAVRVLAHDFVEKSKKDNPWPPVPKKLNGEPYKENEVIPPFSGTKVDLPDCFDDRGIIYLLFFYFDRWRP